VKTLTKIFGQKIDRIERPASDDRHLGNGFGTPEFSASPLNLEFSHRLQREESVTSTCFLTAQLRYFEVPISRF
jgi:hypothetical protein